MVVYMITVVPTGDRYIGSTAKFNTRIRRHLRELETGKHHNIILQDLYDVYGEDSLSIKVIENVQTKSDLFVREQYWIDTLDPEINIGSVGGGDNLTKHPLRDEIIEKIHKSVCARLAAMSEEEILATFAKYGKDNPNYRHGRNISHKCKCGKEISPYADHCKSCATTGNNNHMYGKSHTPETRKLLSEVLSGREMEKLRKGVVGDGMYFASHGAAAEHFGVTMGTITHRIKSENYPQWFNTNNPDDANIKFEIKVRKYMVGDEVFDSIKEICSKFGVKQSTAHYRFKSPQQTEWRVVEL